MPKRKESPEDWPKMPATKKKLLLKKRSKPAEKEFTKELADLADVYVNDAFGTAHRAHASTALIAEYFSPRKQNVRIPHG